MLDYIELATPRFPARPSYGGGTPRGVDPESIVQVESLRDHVETVYLVHHEDSTAEVRSLSIAERTVLEIEMRERSKMTHSFEYDPLP